MAEYVVHSSGQLREMVSSGVQIGLKSLLPIVVLVTVSSAPFVQNLAHLHGLSDRMRIFLFSPCISHKRSRRAPTCILILPFDSWRTLFASFL